MDRKFLIMGLVCMMLALFLCLAAEAAPKSALHSGKVLTYHMYAPLFSRRAPCPEH